VCEISTRLSSSCDSCVYDLGCTICTSDELLLTVYDANFTGAKLVSLCKFKWNNMEWSEDSWDDISDVACDVAEVLGG